MAKAPKCPVCKETVPRDSRHAPFCSGRCRDVDLGSWLQEGYRISRPMMPWEAAQALQDADSSDES